MESSLILPTREEAVAYSWKLGRLNYRRRNTQKFIKNAIEKAKLISRKIYFETTRRLGKSSEMLMMFTEHCLERPGWKAAFFAPVKDGLLDYIEPIIQKTYEDCPAENRPIFNRQRFILEFPNKSIIIFRGSNNQQHRIRRGQEFNEAGIDEARDVDSLDVLVDSVVMPALFSASGGYLYLSSTPADTRSHPLYRYRQVAEAEGWLIRLTIWDAQRLDPEVYTIDKINEWKSETIKSIDGDDVWKREYECEWVVNKSRAAVPEWRPEYVKDLKRDPYYSFYDHYIGIDWGYNDFTAVGFSTRMFRDAALQVEGELSFSGTDVRSDRISQAILRQADKLWGPGWDAYMVSDSADPILINELNKFPKMNFNPVHKAQTLEAMLQQFRVLVNQGKILVSPTCPMTAHCLANAVWDDKREKLDQDVFARHFDHLMQLVYTTRVVDYNRNPIPNDFMIDGIRIVDLSFNKPQDKTQDATAFEQAMQSARNRRFTNA